MSHDSAQTRLVIRLGFRNDLSDISGERLRNGRTSVYLRCERRSMSWGISRRLKKLLIGVHREFFCLSALSIVGLIVHAACVLEYDDT